MIVQHQNGKIIRADDEEYNHRLTDTVHIISLVAMSRYAHIQTSLAMSTSAIWCRVLQVSRFQSPPPFIGTAHHQNKSLTALDYKMPLSCWSERERGEKQRERERIVRHEQPISVSSGSGRPTNAYVRSSHVRYVNQYIAASPSNLDCSVYTCVLHAVFLSRTTKLS